MNSDKVKTRITLASVQERALKVGLYVLKGPSTQHPYCISSLPGFGMGNSKVVIWCENLATVDHRLNRMFEV
jgi:hypothetical protein